MRWQIVGRLSSSSGGLILFYMQAGSCISWGLDSSNHSWLEPRECKLVLGHRASALTLNWCWRNLWRLKSSTLNSLLYWMVFINEYIIELSIYIWCTLSIWLSYCTYTLMVNKCYLCYLRIGCKQLFGKVRKLGKSVHTLISPPLSVGVVSNNL